MKRIKIVRVKLIGWLTLCLVLILPGALQASRAAVQAPASPRFSVELVPVQFAGLPGLQSFSIAQANGKWLILGGRTNGIHTFVQSSNGGSTAPPNAFPPAKANSTVWVIDPAAKRVWSASLKSLSANIADQLSANNAEAYQDGNNLYIIGGYGLSSASRQMTTYGALTRIKVAEMIQAVVSGKPIAPYIQQTSLYYDCVQYGTNAYNSCYGTASGKCQPGSGYANCMKAAAATCQAAQAQAVQQCIGQVQGGSTSGIPTNTGYYARVTGGGLEKVGSVFYLVFGQQFEGLYSVLEGDYGKWPVKQIYTERITALSITPDPLSAAVLNVYQQDPNDNSAPYHRRDLNVLPALSASGNPLIAVHGGVFVPGQDGAYRPPVLLDNATDPMHLKVTVDSYQQMFNQYDCAVLQMFDKNSKNLVTVFFGGISLYYLDPKTKKLKQDEGLPFVDALSAMIRNGAGHWSEFVRAKPLNGLIGTDAKFIPSPAISAASNGVIYLDSIKTNTKVGYVYGGILASQPKTTDPASPPTTASNALYEVWVNPAPPSPSYWLPAIVTTTAPVRRQ